jgi:type I restriction enzyme S subunit
MASPGHAVAQTLPVPDTRVTQGHGDIKGVIASLKPYPEYTPSGVDWLGNVPSQWVLKPGLAAFREKRVKNLNLQEKQVLSLSYGRIVVKPEEKLHGLVPDSFVTYQIVEPGDIIIRSTDLQNDRTSLRVGFVKDMGIITSAYICLRTTRAVVPAYGYQLLNAYDLMKAFYGMGSGLRQNLEWSDFKRMPVFIPPSDDQLAIARFLDHAIRRLDKTINSKRRLIAYLNEQRQLIIHTAISRGLSSDVQLEDSDIQWLGEVPTNWEVLRLGRVIELITGFPFSSAGFSQNPNDTKLLRGINVTPSGIRWNPIVYWRRTTRDGLDVFSLRPGDIVLGMDRPIIASGVRAARIEETDTPSLLLQRVARLRTSARLNPEFLLLLLRGRSFADYIAPIFTGISVPHLSPGQIRSFKIALPSEPEQKEILDYVNEETASVNVAIAVTQREIGLLREYRTRLIVDVVTGKLDVRTAAAGLPVETEEYGEPIPVNEAEGVNDEETELLEAADG